MNENTKSEPVYFGGADKRVPSEDTISRFRSGLVENLIHPKTPEDFNKGETIVSFTWPYLTGLQEALVEAIRRAPDDETIQKVYPIFANRFGLEEIRQYLREYAGKHKDFEKVLVHTDQVLGFDQSKTLPTIDSTYKDIEDEFVHYKPNEELLPYEARLLKRTFKPGQKILDIGFGPAARHMNALQKAKIRVTGIDIVPSNAKRARKDNPTLDVSVVDWHNLPFPDGSFDGAYCLGRSMLHNTTLDDWLQTLREIQRVLGFKGLIEYEKDYPRKKLLIDIPDVQKGSYRKESAKFSEKAGELGIHDYERGVIHDSPDQKHFLDRYVPSISQFRIMAKICGFEAKIISKKPYGTEGDGNIYWELMPNGRPLRYQEYMRQYGRELIRKPFLTIDVSRQGY
jgi:ubiquinone/menaquinone biosynthesis C-methylase UbiE